MPGAGAAWRGGRPWDPGHWLRSRWSGSGDGGAGKAPSGRNARLGRRRARDAELRREPRGRPEPCRAHPRDPSPRAEEPRAIGGPDESEDCLRDTACSGYWQLGLSLERDTCGATRSSSSPSTARTRPPRPRRGPRRRDPPRGFGTRRPHPLARGTHLVRVGLPPNTFTGEPDAWCDVGDGNGVLHGLRLRRVGEWRKGGGGRRRARGCARDAALTRHGNQ